LYSTIFFANICVDIGLYINNDDTGRFV